MGPEVSKVFEIGIIPDRLTNPMVGFNPTIELAEDGDKIEPEVSEPSETAEKLAEIAAPLPLISDSIVLGQIRNAQLNY